jgi:hypothetical protein
MGPNPQLSPLWLLEELDVRDKHKLVTTIQGLSRTARFSVNDDPIAITIPYPAMKGRVEHDAIFAEVPGEVDPIFETAIGRW